MQPWLSAEEEPVMVTSFNRPRGSCNLPPRARRRMGPQAGNAMGLPSIAMALLHRFCFVSKKVETSIPLPVPLQYGDCSGTALCKSSFVLSIGVESSLGSDDSAATPNSERSNSKRSNSDEFCFYILEARRKRRRFSQSKLVFA